MTANIRITSQPDWQLAATLEDALMISSFLLAAIPNWVVVSALAFVGVDYLASRMVKPHHLKILDVPWDTLTPGNRTLIMTMMKGTGLLALVTAISMAVVLTGPFLQKSPWSRTAILIISGATLIPTLLGTFKVRRETGAPAPWWPHIAMIAALAAAYYLTNDFSGTSP